MSVPELFFGSLFRMDEAEEGRWKVSVRLNVQEEWGITFPLSPSGTSLAARRFLIERSHPVPLRLRTEDVEWPSPDMFFKG